MRVWKSAFAMYFFFGSVLGWVGLVGPVGLVGCGAGGKENLEGRFSSTLPCPKDFVPVSTLKGYTSRGFCVAKYEMKKNNNSAKAEAISQKRGRPWTRITQGQAIKACQYMGEGYDLITNEEWQTVARHIEKVTANWYGNSVASKGGLNQGYTCYLPLPEESQSESQPSSQPSSQPQNQPQTEPEPVLQCPSNLPLEAGGDKEGCYKTGQSCDPGFWDLSLRTHTLSNGKVLWDMAGNVSEWVKARNGDVWGKDDVYISKITGNAKKLFGPQGDYGSIETKTPPTFEGKTIRGLGLGKAFLDHRAGGVLRGGGLGDGHAGLFAVSLRESQNFLGLHVGFRCVYHPYHNLSDPRSLAPPPLSIPEE